MRRTFDTIAVLRGRLTAIRVTRFTVEQNVQFRSKFFQQKGRIRRREALMKDPEGLADADFDQQQEAATEDALKINRWYCQQVEQHIEVLEGNPIRRVLEQDGLQVDIPPELLAAPDFGAPLLDAMDQPILTGAQLLDECADDIIGLRDIVSGLYLENNVGPKEKKEWKRRVLSELGSSPQPAAEPSGERPDAAASAALTSAVTNPDEVKTGTAPDERDTRPSGSSSSPGPAVH